MILPIILLLISSILFVLLYRKSMKNLDMKNIKKGQKKWTDYYENLPQDFSPAMVSFLCEQTKDYNNILASTIFNLSSKGFLSITENSDSFKIECINSSKISSLQKHEQYVIDWISSGSHFNEKEWSDLILKDLRATSLVTFTTSKYRPKPLNILLLQTNLLVILLTIILSSILCIFMVNVGLNYSSFIEDSQIATTANDNDFIEYSNELKELYDHNSFILTGYIFVSLFILLGIPIYILLILTFYFPSAKMLYSKKFKYLRTTQGIIDYKNWMLFREFIYKFNDLFSKRKPNVTIWQHYLSYSLALRS